MTLQVNDQAPDFKAPATDGKTLSLTDFKGQALVLYFYPRDNTPGCTQEGQDFRDLYAQFQKENAAILGVSRDSIKKHDNFRAKHDFPFDLISDEEEQICQAYGVLKEKKMFGKTNIGIERSTFLIDRHGVIRQIWRGVKVADHAQEVLTSLRNLTDSNDT